MGSPRITADLNQGAPQDCVRVRRKRVARLMRAAGIAWGVWSLPSRGSETQTRVPVWAQATCTLSPVVLCLPE